MDKKISKFNFSKLVTYITVLTPALYIFGYFYELGFLSAFGLSNEFFPRDTQSYLVKFFYVFIHFISGIISFSLKYYWWFFLEIIAIAFFYIFIETKTSKRIVNWLEGLRERLKDKKYSSKFFVPFFASVITIVLGHLVISSLLAILVIFLAPYHLGKEIALKQIKNYVGCELKKEPLENDCVFIYQGEKLMLSGLLIANSEKNIAVWKGDKAIVFPLNDEIIVVKKKSSDK